MGSMGSVASTTNETDQVRSAERMRDMMRQTVRIA